MPATRTLPQVNQPTLDLDPISGNQKLLRIASRKSDRPGRPRENLTVANQSSPTKTFVARKSQPPASTNHKPALTALNSSLQPLEIAFPAKFPPTKTRLHLAPVSRPSTSCLRTLANPSDPIIPDTSTPVADLQRVHLERPVPDALLFRSFTPPTCQYHRRTHVKF
ncbi:hypothetical protein V500_11504 [Pseudogymnoascus sp. VKM F-4518 (FW-2643)]|nr:hypothetical protein V500_11504 [Pseudogymnoascus sp. VKM F-4518 (FW-2643)]